MLGSTYSVFDYLLMLLGMLGESAQGFLGLLAGFFTPASTSAPYTW